MRKIIIIAALAVVAMASCTKEDSSATTSESQIIEFVSESIATRVNSAGDEWTAGDQIGVFMYDNALEQPNRKYEALTGGESTTRFVPADDEDYPLEYCESDMNFRAYYPYSEDVFYMDVKLEFDCSDQIKVDFLWAEKEGAARGDVISLPFEHKMSRLELVITPLDNISSLGGLEASITGVLTKGSVDISTGDVEGTSGDDVELTFATVEYNEDSEAESGYSISENGYADMVSATVIFFPQTLSSAAEVTITVGDRIFSITIPVDAEFVSGQQHRYYVAVGNDYVEFVGNTIVEWSEDTTTYDDLYGWYNN